MKNQPTGLGRLSKVLLVALLCVYVVYLSCVGLMSTVAGQSYVKPNFEVKDDSSMAKCMAEGLVQPLDEELNSLFGWLPNDLFFVPKIIDNKTNFQRGVIYATRTASDWLSQEIARYGVRDTVPTILTDATRTYFAYDENVWGMFLLYNAEKKYAAGVQEWRTWANNIGNVVKKEKLVFNMTTADVVGIIKWAEGTCDYALGVLNNTGIGHFSSDDTVYYVKGIMRVVGSITQALLLCDETLTFKGGKENVDECLKRLDMIRLFNPICVFAGSSGVGDSLNPSHIASLARHVDVFSNRLADIRKAIEK